MSKIKLICFDLDETLIKTIHSVMFLCILNGKQDELREIESREDIGQLHWIESDYQKVRLIKGLDEAKIHAHFDDILKPLKNIADVIDTLRQMGLQSILITAGPKQVAKAASEKWGFDAYYGSDYEVVDGVFTGKILQHMGDAGKIACLEDYCAKHNIQPSECIAVGDGVTDMPLFAHCRASVAVNYSPLVLGKATHYLKTDNMYEVLEKIKMEL